MLYGPDIKSEYCFADKKQKKDIFIQHTWEVAIIVDFLTGINKCQEMKEPWKVFL